MKHLARILISLFMVVGTLLSGCGGGTTGSGDASGLRVMGGVRSPDGTPISEALVSDIVSGTSTSTDSAGAFVLNAQRTDGAVSLDVTAQGTSGTITVPNVPDTTTSITIEVVVDSVSGIVSLASVEMESTDSPGSSNDVTQDIRGSILSRSSKPVSAAVVSIAGTHVRQTSDTSGRFVMVAKTDTGSITLRIQYKNHTGAVTIKGIPRDRSVKLGLRLTLSIDAGQDPGDGNGGGSKLSIDVNNIDIS
jgi:hypothetical protein